MSLNGNYVKKLRPRHHEIIRLAFLGLKQKDIAKKIGLTDATVSCILTSRMARNELERMNKEAETDLVSVVNRADVIQECSRAAAEAVRINRTLMNDASVATPLRVRISTHFMDRVIFGQDDPETREAANYRDILRAIKNITPKPAPIVDTTAVLINEHNNGIAVSGAEGS